MKRDHEAEWKRWTSWLDHIAKRVSDDRRVTTTIVQPAGLSNRMPSLRVLWDRQRLGMSGRAGRAARSWTATRASPCSPPAARRDPAQTGVTVNPYMMAPGDEKIVADRLHAVLSNPPRRTRRRAARPPARTSAATGTCRSSTRPAPRPTRSHLRQTRQRDRRLAPGRLRVARPLRHDRRRHSAAPQRLRRGARRLAQLHLHRQR